jgi:outer membrane receptor for monomeric catechols
MSDVASIVALADPQPNLHPVRLRGRFVENELHLTERSLRMRTTRICILRERLGVSAKGSRGGIRSIVRGKWRAGAWLGAASLAAGVAHAAEDEAPGDVVEVVGKRLDQGLGTRYTAPLLETPATASIFAATRAEQRRISRTDGVRDSAQYSRTDPFTRAARAVSGANSVYTGRGVGRRLHQSRDEAPTGMAGTVLDFAGGGDSYARITLTRNRGSATSRTCD